METKQKNMSDHKEQWKEEYAIVLRSETLENLEWGLKHAEEEGFTEEYIEAIQEELQRRTNGCSYR